MRLIYTEEEFKALLATTDNMVNKIHDLVKTIANQEHEKEMLRLKKEKGIRKHTFIVDDGDEDSEDDSEYDFDEITNEERTIPFMVHKNKNTTKVKEEKEEADIADSVENGDLTEEEARALKQAVQKGEKIFQDLVALWLINFMKEDTEQPPRADTLKDLSLTKDGKRLLHYVIDSGGLTWAVKKCWPSGRKYDPFLVRYVAENITQVSSILFPEVAQYLEHPNPLSE